MQDIRDFILFECLTALIIGHALLSTANTAEQTQVFFYALLLVMNFVCLILIHLYYKEGGQLVDYNENLTERSLIFILIGVLGVFVCCAIITSAWTSSVIYVPTFAFQIAVDLPAFTTVVLYNIALIANSEETTKLVGHNALYMYLMNHFPKKKKEVEFVSAVLPIGFWATLHAYIAYVGPILWQLVAAAFVAGLIIFAVMWKTKSLLAAITTHGLYNIIVLSAAGLGWMELAVSPQLLLGMAIVNLILLSITYWSHRKWNRCKN